MTSLSNFRGPTSSTSSASIGPGQQHQHQQPLTLGLSALMPRSQTTSALHTQDHPRPRQGTDRADGEGGGDDDADDDDEADHEGDGREATEMLNEATVKAGYLWKKGEKRKTWKKRWFVLRSSKLSYYKNEKEYQLLRYIDMSDVLSVAAIELKGRDNTFGIVTQRRAYYVKASNRAEMEEWTTALNEVKTQMSQRNTLTHDMVDLNIDSHHHNEPSSSSAPLTGRGVTRNATEPHLHAPAVSINIPGKNHPVPQTRLVPGSADPMSPLTATTDSDTGAEQFGLSYTSSTGYSYSLASSPGREGNRSGSEASDAGGSSMAALHRASVRRNGPQGSSSGGSLRRPEGKDAIVGSPDAYSYQSSGVPVLSSSDEDEDDDEQLDRAMPLPSLATAISSATQTSSQETVSAPRADEAAPLAAPQALGAGDTPDVMKCPDRIIMQSYLLKQSKGRKQWRKRWFVLTASRLVYTRSHMNKKALREVPISSILDAIEYSASQSGHASPGTIYGGLGVSSQLGGGFNFGAFGAGDATTRNTNDGSGQPSTGPAAAGLTRTAPAAGSAATAMPASSQHREDEAGAAASGVSSAAAPAPAPRRQSVVAAAAGMASSLGAGVGLERDGGSKKRMDNCFKVITPKRVFLLCAPTEEEEIKWLSALQALLARTRGSKRAAAAATASPALDSGTVQAGVEARE
ncbi:unnamed protein product [Parajaminaea phylloscopi]